MAARAQQDAEARRRRAEDALVRDAIGDPSSPSGILCLFLLARGWQMLKQQLLTWERDQQLVAVVHVQDPDHVSLSLNGERQVRLLGVQRVYDHLDEIEHHERGGRLPGWLVADFWWSSWLVRRPDADDRFPEWFDGWRHERLLDDGHQFTLLEGEFAGAVATLPARPARWIKNAPSTLNVTMPDGRQATFWASEANRVLPHFKSPEDQTGWAFPLRNVASILEPALAIHEQLAPRGWRFRGCGPFAIWLPQDERPVQVVLIRLPSTPTPAVRVIFTVSEGIATSADVTLVQLTERIAEVEAYEAGAVPPVWATDRLP
ncbi:hypothetical protein GCM10022273_06570 [Cellulomonas soli]